MIKQVYVLYGEKGGRKWVIKIFKDGNKAKEWVNLFTYDRQSDIEYSYEPELYEDE